jgi:hypothetical protein
MLFCNFSRSRVLSRKSNKTLICLLRDLNVFSLNEIDSVFALSCASIAFYRQGVIAS